MKILLVTPMPPSPQAPGAIPLVLYAQLTGLHTLGHEVTVLTLVEQDPAEEETIKRLQAEGYEVEPVRRTEQAGFALWRRRWRRATGLLSGRYPWRAIWFYEPGMQRRLDELLTNREFDVIAVEDNSMANYRFNTKTPLVFTEHEVRRPRPINWSGFMSSKKKISWLINELDWQRWPGYERRIWPRFDRIQVFTAHDAEAIRQIRPELAGRVRINPFGVNLGEPLDPTCEEPSQLLLSGNFSHPPNVDGALWLGQEIMPLLRRRYPGVRLNIVGNAPPPPVKALACKDIKVTGRVPEIEPYIEKAAVIIAPLRIGGGQRMKVLQGMSMGKAVVTTRRGAEGLAVPGYDLPLAVADDAEGFADATVRLLENVNARRELGRQARAFVEEHYSPVAYARRLETVYQELLPAGVA